MVVLHHRAEDRFVALYQKTRRLQADHQFLGRDDFRAAFADLRALAQHPDAGFPSGEVVREFQRDFGAAVGVGLNRTGPFQEIGEILADKDGTRGSHSFADRLFRHLSRSSQCQRSDAKSVAIHHPGNRTGAITPADSQCSQTIISEAPERLHAYNFRPKQISCWIWQGIRSTAWIEIVFPSPEILMNRSDVRPSGDRFERLVVDGKNGNSCHRFSFRVPQGHPKTGFLARFHPVLRGFKSHLDQLAHRRQQDLPDGGMHLRVEDRDAFDKHVWHIPQIERDIDFQALAIQLDAPRLTPCGACDVEKEPDVRVRLVAVHAEFHGFAGGISRLVGHQFQRAEIPVRRIRAAGGLDVENRRAFRRLAVFE